MLNGVNPSEGFAYFGLEGRLSGATPCNVQRIMRITPTDKELGVTPCIAGYYRCARIVFELCRCTCSLWDPSIHLTVICLEIRLWNLSLDRSDSFPREVNPDCKQGATAPTSSVVYSDSKRNPHMTRGYMKECPHIRNLIIR